MFTSIITGTIITKYENAFAAIPLLVSFIPMLMDTGGNCGSQSSTLIIRGIASLQIHFRDIFRVIFKEFRISLIVGAVLAVTNGIRIMIQYDDFNLALVIALSLIGTVIMSKLIGCMLPLLASRVHLDPAIMASPLITTLVDIFSILIYFISRPSFSTYEHKKETAVGIISRSRFLFLYFIRFLCRFFSCRFPATR